MIDRIAEPWGTRTPYGRGEHWPVRVDMYQEGAEPDQVTWVETASILHSNGDALEIAVRDGELLDAVSRCHSQTLRGMKWTLTRLKTAAPQVLAG